MRILPWTRVPFVIAVALVAAAIADPLVETIANTGMLGRGYSDNDHASVVPTLLVGSMLLLLAIAARCLGLVCRACVYRRWVAGIARHLSARPALADLPYIVLLQFVALFIMESCEHLLYDGRLAGGIAWLGGPIWFSIATHLLIGLLCTILAARAVRTIVRRCAALVSIALDFILCALGISDASLFAPRRHEATRRYVQPFHVRQVGQRAPPLLLTTLA